MSSRQLFIITPTLNSELLISIATLQFGKSIHGHTWRTCDELQEAKPQLIRKRVHSHPEPLYDTMMRMVFALIDRVQLPVFNIDIAETGEQELEFFRIEYEYASLRYDFAEAFHETMHLLLDSLHESPLYDQIDELFLVVVRHFYVLSAWF